MAAIMSSDSDVGPKNTAFAEDSQWNSCHQCRQKRYCLAATCQKVKEKGKCPLKFCETCLKNRYGLAVKEVNRLPDWECPKCQGICRCSVCQRLRGEPPTGCLAPQAKKSGFRSVAEMISVVGIDSLGLDKKLDVSPKKRGKENSSDERVDVKSNATMSGDEQDVKKAKWDEIMEICNDSREGGAKSADAAADNKESAEYIAAKAKGKGKTVRGRPRIKQCAMNVENKVDCPEVALPPGTPLTTILGIPFGAEDAGNGLQFLQFCKDFGEVLNIEKQMAESVLRELARPGSGRSGRPGQYSSVIQFHIQMLSVIQEDRGEKCPSSDQSWFQDLGKCISEPSVLEFDPVLKAVPSGCFSRGADGYEILTFSQKLRLLTVLCDESLCTHKLRNWMEKQNGRSAQTIKEAKGKVTKAKEKEKQLKNKLKAEMAKRATVYNGDAISITEHESILSQIQIEANQARAELMEANHMLPKTTQASESVRKAPYRSNADGHTFWKLNAYSGEDTVLLQDIGSGDEVPSDEKWFVYGAEMKEPLDQYFSSLSLREIEARRQQMLLETVSESYEEDIELSSGGSNEVNMAVDTSESNEGNAELSSGVDTSGSSQENMEVDLRPEVGPGECGGEKMELKPEVE